MRLSVMAVSLWMAGAMAARAQKTAPADTGAVTSQSQPSPELDLNAYKAELARIAESVQSKQNLGSVRKSLPPSWKVRIRDESFEVSTREISAALAEIERNPSKSKHVEEQLQLRLQALQRGAQEMESAPGANVSTEAEARGKLKEVLNRSEFQQAAGPSAWEMMRARILRWIFEHIIWLLRWLHISERTGNYFAWSVIFLAVVVLFYAVYRWLSKMAGRTDFVAETEPVASDVRQWLAEALSAAERGDYREAIHCAYWASIARMEDMRLLARDRARTPRESLRLLEQHPREKGFLQAVTRSFELIWYGYRPASQTDWAAAREQLENLGCLQASIAPIAQS
jgi:hypothetical protein